MERDSSTTSSLIATVVEKVAEREGVEPMALRPPLYDVVDPDALDAVFAPTDLGDPRARGRVEFEYCGHTVVVRSDGQVRIDDEAQRRSTATEGTLESGGR